MKNYLIKSLMIVFFMTFYCTTNSQSLQLYYDFRHTIDPKLNPHNFPTLLFEYPKTLDSGKIFIKPGSFYIKLQSDFKGLNRSSGQIYTQLSETFRFWKPQVFVYVEYRGGLGVSEPGSYGYYITNGFSIGVTHFFRTKKGFFIPTACLRYNNFVKPSYDAMIIFYWWRGLWKSKAEFLGDFQLWTFNNNHGDESTANLHGKIVSLYGEPTFWYNINKKFSTGTRVLFYYHILTNDNKAQLYPTIAVRYRL